MRAGALPAAGVLAAVALVAPQAAEGGWSNAHSVRGASVVTAPALASNQRGDVLLAWIDRRGVMVASAHGGGRLGRAHRVPGGFAARVRKAGEIKAAIDETGMAAVAWTDCRPLDPGPSPRCGLEVRAAVRRPGHGFSRARRISDAGKPAGLGDVVARSGRAVVTYGQHKLGTRSAAFVAHSAGHGFKRQRIARFARSPGVVRAADGSERLLYATDTGLRAVTRAASGRLGPSREVVRTKVRFYLDAGGAYGQQALIWKTVDAGALRAGLLLPGRSIAPRTLDPGPNGVYGFAIDGAANGQFVTVFVNKRNLRGIRYSRRVPGRAGFAAPRDLPKAGLGLGRALDVSVRPDGAAAVTWIESGSGSVRVGILGIDGRMRATHSFTRDPAAGDPIPETSIDGLGRAWLTWHDGDGLLRVARYAR